jgi:hypothetical protein
MARLPVTGAWYDGSPMAVQPRLTVPDLWTLTRQRQWIDPAELAAAVEQQVSGADLDFRTRLLIRDSLDALESHWGPERARQMIASSDQWSKLEEIRRSDLGPPGFPSLPHRLMETTRSERSRLTVNDWPAVRHAGPQR